MAQELLMINPRRKRRRRRNPSGIRWSGCVARPKSRRHPGKRFRLIRARAGRSRRAFLPAWAFPKRVKSALLRRCRRDRRRGCSTAIGRSTHKRCRRRR